MKKSMYLFLLIFGTWLMGCTPFQMTLTNEERSLPAISPEKVQLFYPGEIIPPSKEIGYVVVTEKSEKKGVAFLREKAASIGADAIVNFEVKVQTQTLFLLIIPIPVSSYFISGTAVSFNK